VRELRRSEVSSPPRKKIYTKYGDAGQTSLLYGGRVSKSSPYTEAYGITDEAVSAMGLARALSQEGKVKDILQQLQQELFTVGAELATDPQHYELFKRHFKPLAPETIARLEGLIDELEQLMEMPNVFILPGGSPASAALDMARSIIRTGERRTVALKEDGKLSNPDILRYLNRLGDLLFVLARYEDRGLPLEKVTGERP
jgi:cob(I)alamin adenosyltransferase